MHREVEGGIVVRNLLLSVHRRGVGPVVEPPFHLIEVAVKNLADREARLCRLVVVDQVLGMEATRHIITEAGIAQSVGGVKKEALVCLYCFLDIGTAMVEVACPVKRLTGLPVYGSTGLLTVCRQRQVTVSQCIEIVEISLGRSAIIIIEDIGRRKMISLALVGLRGEREHIGLVDRGAVIDDHIFYNAGTLLLVCRNHRLQLVLRAEARVVIEIIVRHIAHGTAALVRHAATLRNPYKVEIL